MDLRLFSAIFAGKIIKLILKLKGSGATAAPGLIALKIDPKLISKMTKQLKNGSIIVTGTNGKTTTSRLIFNMIKEKYRIIHNRQGSNLMRGIASTLIVNSNLLGKLEYEIGLWEVDEAVTPIAIRAINPKSVLFLNLFRDQLDRYGEIDSIRKLWKKSAESLKPNTTIVLNADDPGVLSLKTTTKAKIVTFGIEEKESTFPKIIQKGDVKHCPICFSKLRYETTYSSHLGIYSCTNIKCGFKRVNPNFVATQLTNSRDFKTKFTIKKPGFKIKIQSNLPGVYNVYNQLAAVATSQEFEKDITKLSNTLKSYDPAFGRFQKLDIANKKIVIFLIKNPTGANEILRLLTTRSDISLLIALNDLLADGTDISWIWDTDWEVVKDKIKDMHITGLRAWDMANRLKYAGYKMNKDNIHENIKYSLDSALSNLDKEDTLIILPTYTALLELQKYISKQEGISTWQRQ